MIFTEADLAKLYRLDSKIEKKTATIKEMCEATKLRIRKRLVLGGK